MPMIVKRTLTVALNTGSSTAPQPSPSVNEPAGATSRSVTAASASTTLTAGSTALSHVTYWLPSASVAATVWMCTSDSEAVDETTGATCVLAQPPHSFGHGKTWVKRGRNVGKTIAKHAERTKKTRKTCAGASKRGERAPAAIVPRGLLHAHKLPVRAAGHLDGARSHSKPAVLDEEPHTIGVGDGWRGA
jgi:hypothetical protein